MALLFSSVPSDNIYNGQGEKMKELVSELLGGYFGLNMVRYRSSS